MEPHAISIDITEIPCVLVLQVEMSGFGLPRSNNPELWESERDQSRLGSSCLESEVKMRQNFTIVTSDSRGALFAYKDPCDGAIFISHADTNESTANTSVGQHWEHLKSQRPL